jgi:hypothetical protein
MASSITFLFATGSVPGCPKVITLTFVFGWSPYALGSVLYALLSQ